MLNRLGDVESIGLGEQGLYHNGTRHLSRLVVRLGDKIPQLLRSTIQDDNAFLTLDMMNPDVYRDGTLLLPRGSVHLFRSKFLWRHVCYDRLRLANFSTHSLETSVSFDFAADFADIFQVRGSKRDRTGDLHPAVIENDCVVLSYHGLDGELRRTRLHFSPIPDRISQNAVRFVAKLEPKEETSIAVNVSCDQPETNRATVDFGRAMTEALSGLDEMRRRFCHIATSNARFNTWLSRSEADIHMMISGNPEGAYPYAGVPWFSTVFGRDGILTAMQCLWTAPWIAKSVLKYLAENQATSNIPDQEAEPGKILHEMRRGEMANLKEVPVWPLLRECRCDAFVCHACRRLPRSHCGPSVAQETSGPTSLAALDWIDILRRFGSRRLRRVSEESGKGADTARLERFHDSVFHHDGSLASAPIALCEVQGYVYGAKKAAAQIATKIRTP